MNRCTTGAARVEAFGGDFLDHGEGAFARRAAGAVGDREEFRLQFGQLGPDGAQFSTPSGVCGGKLDGDFSVHLFNQMKNSRLPSPPVIGLSSQAADGQAQHFGAIRAACARPRGRAPVATMPPRPMLPGPTSNCGFDEQQQVAAGREQRQAWAGSGSAK